MDAYDEGSNAPHGPDAPDGPAPDTARAPGTASASVDAAPATGTGPSSSDTETGSAPAVPAQGGPATPHHVPAADADSDRDRDRDGDISSASTGTATCPGPGSGPGGRRPSVTDAPYSPHSPYAPAAQPAGRMGITALSLPYQIVAALALAVVAVAACVHLGMVFLHVAPSNTVTKKHGRAIDEWVYPEFEQNWMLFAPNPLQQNISVQVRAEVRGADGSIRTTGWYDLTALDGAAIDGSLLPSHTRQNELRRAWELYVGSHDSENRPTGQRGDLAERYLRRIVVLRLERENAAGPGGLVEHIQVRSRTTNVPPPEWSEEKVSDKPIVRELPWWKVTERDRTEARP
ncbi:DUF5819 family protein [Streptomyces bluensis]|uniref:DUF5819 family protein n=1 Tax=Streptomyces bluensis TaxID=33897 RepID=UPI0033230D93